MLEKILFEFYLSFRVREKWEALRNFIANIMWLKDWILNFYGTYSYIDSKIYIGMILYLGVTAVLYQS